MLRIEGNDLEPIQSVAKQLYTIYNPKKLGAWGILYLCCGAMSARNSLWEERINKNIYTLVCPSDLKKILQGEDVFTSDDYAWRFSEFIIESSNNSHAIAAAEERMEQYRGKLSDETFLCRKKYLTLTYMLNSLQDLTRKELLGFDSTWVSISDGKQYNYGWPELFFAAGFMLSYEDSVDCYKFALIIHDMGKSNNVDVAPLFEQYAGYNPFLKSGSTKIRTDQLKKGMRVRMRNGLEAIVVKECDGNTLTAKVFGAFTETGSVYAHNVVAAEVDGKWVEVK